jgi:dinuclear metal center YbgI/SA1388 family protein
VSSPTADPDAPALRDVVAALNRRYPPGAAEEWDRPGTVCGDPAAPVRRVLFAVDPTAEVVAEALAWGADLLVTHHPLLLRPVHSVAATTWKGALVHRLVRGGCALHAAHTNADAARGGVAEALAEAVGLVDLVPLVAQPAPALDKVVVMVPADHAEGVLDAMAAAGAGAVGDYSRCAWTASGTGTFLPGPAAHPAIGTPGEVAVVREDRLEMVAPRAVRAAVVAALRGAHPYEEPAFDVLELAALPAPTGIGRVGRLPEPTTLAAFGAVVAQALPRTAHGVRLAGDLDGAVRTVAVVGGSGDSLFDAVRASGADAYLTADLRHHPASEARERAAFDAGSTDPRHGTPYLVDVSHAASEWPWLAVAARTLEQDLAAGPVGARPRVETRVSTLRTDPWTTRLDPTPGGPR